jgi:hypothetical protein
VLGVGKDRKGGLEFFLSDSTFFGGIDAHAQDLHIERFQLFEMLDELAEFGIAVRSPIASIEIDQDVVAGEIGELDALAFGRGQREIGRLISNFDMEWQQWALRGADPGRDGKPSDGQK